MRWFQMESTHFSLVPKERGAKSPCPVFHRTTPKTDVDRNTYDFFEMEHGVPTYAYDYETAVYKDHVMVPYYNIETKLKFLEQGIAYDELSDADKQWYEEDFTDEDGGMPDFIPSPQINEFIFNQYTVDTVLQDLMTKGVRVAGGGPAGKNDCLRTEQEARTSWVKNCVMEVVSPLPCGKSSNILHHLI